MNRTAAVLCVLATLAAPSSTRAQDDALPPARAATPAEAVTVPKGFKIELLHSATDREGSWVSMAVDDKGRLYISPQNKTPAGGIVRLTLDGDGRVARKDWLKPDVGAAMGMLWAFDSLYVNGQGPDGQAIYRLRDTDGDDQLDGVTLFKKVPGGAGEHGAHAIVLGPDNMLYFAHGNSTPPVEGVAPDSPHRNWQEDFLLPRIMDPVATFFDNLKVPYGHVLRTDENGEKWELYAGGFRNQYDIDFNPDGELFTFDSDMEWDIGLPWYRPTRVLHVTSGAEFGFREGSTKWPAYYPDSLPAAVDVGTGSPTGVKFGTKSNFPAPYRSAFFIMDWTYGRILAIHLKFDGSTYTAGNPLPNPYNPAGPSSSPDVEVFVSGKAMPMTDLEFGKDGAMYFITGGRGTQSGLYRVSYVGQPETVAPYPPPGAADAADARALRRKLEALHGKPDPAAVEIAWPHLDSEDRFIRYAARIAIESQPVAQWRDRALAEQEPRAAITALVALARLGDKDTQPLLLKALGRFPLDSLPEDLKLDKLRVIELSFIRQGRPSDALAEMAIRKLSKQYPAKTFAMNRELSQLLVWLGAPDAVEKTLGLLQTAKDPAEQIWYANVLHSAGGQWTDPQREAYFGWFNRARDYKGGNSFGKFILAIRDRALEKLSEPERQKIAAVLDRKPASASNTPPLPAVKREFQKQWTMADLAGDLEKAGAGRNFERGREVFASQQCLACHRFGADGGGVGPDITAVGSRFNRRDLLESILEPSKVVSEQYATYAIKTRDGKTHVGQIAEETNDGITLIIDPLKGTTERLSQTQVTGKKMSKLSPMPAGLLDVLTKDEILDLLAYIETGGKQDAPQFRAAN